jgi:signal peptidase I
MSEITEARDEADEQPREDAEQSLEVTEPRPPTHEEEPETPADQPRARRFVGSTPFLILVALCVAILIKTFVVQAFFIPSESMVPTLEVGDRVFVNKFLFDGGDIHRGDVVVFENPNSEQLPDRGVIGGFLHWLGEGIGLSQPENEDFIKRVIALPGETWEMRDGATYVDGRRLRERYVNQADPDTRSFGPETVPDGMLFVMGDNRNHSGDSRFPPPGGLGYIPIDRVIGQAFVIIWPPSRAGWLH